MYIFFTINNWTDITENKSLIMEGELFLVESLVKENNHEYSEVLSLAKVEFKYHETSLWNWTDTTEIYSLYQAMRLSRALAFCYKIAETYIDGFEAIPQGRKEAEQLLNGHTITDNYLINIKYL